MLIYGSTHDGGALIASTMKVNSVCGRRLLSDFQTQENPM
jgi:hypothetical protein